MPSIEKETTYFFFFLSIFEPPILRSDENRKKEHHEKTRGEKNLKSDLCIAGDLGSLTVTAQRDAATLGEGLEDRAEIESNLNTETSDGIKLGTVVDGGGVDSDLHVDSVTPSGVDLNDGSTSVHDEGTMAIVGTLAGPDEIPPELDVVHAIEVVEIPAEGTPAVVLEALKLVPFYTLGHCTSPVSLVVNNRLAVLDDFPHGLADGDDGRNVDVVLRIRLLKLDRRAGELHRSSSGGGQTHASKNKVFVLQSKSNVSKSQKINDMCTYKWWNRRTASKK